MAGRTKWVLLAVEGLAWTLWCLISAAPVAAIVGLLGGALRRSDLSKNALVAVLVEMILLGLTSFALFRQLARRGAPAWFWVVAPAGYVLSFAGYVLLERFANGALLTATPGVVMEVLAVSAIVSAGAYLGGVRRQGKGPAGMDETAA